MKKKTSDPSVKKQETFVVEPDVTELTNTGEMVEDNTLPDVRSQDPTSDLVPTPPTAPKV